MIRLDITVKQQQHLLTISITYASSKREVLPSVMHDQTLDALEKYMLKSIDCYIWVENRTF